MHDDRQPRVPLKSEGLGPFSVAVLIVVLVVLVALGAVPGPVAWELIGH